MPIQERQLPGEFELIAEYFAPLSEGFSGAYGLLDDAATISPALGCDLVVKTDAIVGGVHFHADDPADLVARKALRVNLSDLACKGAVARAYMLGLILPSTVTTKWLSAFSEGLAADQQQYGVHLIGGDTNTTQGSLTIAVTAFGEVPQGRMLRRNGAEAGDLIFVTGTIGDAALGLRTLRGELPTLKPQAASSLISRYRLPQPRVDIGPQLLNVATATIDVSDGLIADLQHICDVCGLAAVVESKKVPLSPAAGLAIATKPDLLAVALTGGDDYEILFTAPPDAVRELSRLAQSSCVPLTMIGRMEKPSPEAGNQVLVRGSDDALSQYAQRGWTHF